MNFSSFVVNSNRETAREKQPWSQDYSFVNEHAFQKMISVERKRTERSRKPFLLMLLDTGARMPAGVSDKLLGTIASALMTFTREIDVKGWYRDKSVIGVMFTGIVIDENNSITSTLLGRMSEILRMCLSTEQAIQVNISFHVFPEEWEANSPKGPSNPKLYPDLLKRDDSRRLFRFIKRVIDILGSSLALVFFSPVFLFIAVAIRVGSPGPILFRQKRVGQYGNEFTFLKFRSMYANNDANVHKEWFKRFRTGQEERHPTNGNGDGSFKLPNDPRVTRIGRLLRRTSLDELPQFINVLKGEMSLVGPRPPIGYEVEAYEAWHRRRILEAKPGITGLWQVKGRSRVTFDEMVRLDIQYAHTCSLWLDVKILLHTPLAVVLGEGAY